VLRWTLHLSDLGGREGRDPSLQPLGHALRPVFEQGRPLTPDQDATRVSFTGFRDHLMSGCDVRFQGQTRVMILLGTRPKC
jgi:hypothetical protein